MNEHVQIVREADPSCKLPINMNQPVWRYMDIDKFTYLVEKEALYLCRADRLQDRFEGRYSRQQITDMGTWLKSRGLHDVKNAEANYRAQTRKQTYISCWCMSDCDYDLMWKAYVRNPPGIAIKSMVIQLQAICDQNVDHWPLDISVVTYYDQAAGQHINYDRLSPYLHKDSHFRLDTEIRIVEWGSSLEPTPDHVDLSVIPKQLIHAVVLQPRSSVDILRGVKSILDSHGLGQIPVEFSRDDRDPVD